MLKAERKEKEREMRRNEIIDAAEKLFFSKGYENVTMDDIAKEIGMARGTLYLSFKNKEDIYVSIAIRASKIVGEMFRTIDQKGKTGIEKIRSIVKTYYEFYTKYNGYYMAYYNSGMFKHEGSPELVELKSIRMRSFNIVVDAMRDGMKDGTIRKDMDPVATTLIMLFCTNNALSITPVTRMYMEHYGLSQDELFKRTLEMMLRSLDSKKTDKSKNKVKK